MSTQILIKKLEREVQELKGDVRQMKKFLFAPLKDPEGAYQKSFVKKMIARAEDRGPMHRFIDKRSFLAHVRSPK